MTDEARFRRTPAVERLGECSTAGVFVILGNHCPTRTYCIDAAGKTRHHRRRFQRRLKVGHELIADSLAELNYSST